MSATPPGRHREKDDVERPARLLVRDELVARRPRADDHLLAARPEPLGEALAEVAAAANDSDHRIASSTASAHVRSRLAAQP